MKKLFLLVLLFTASNSKAQYDRLYYSDVDFRETKADTLDVKPDSILLMGMGASLERIFLNDLNNFLIQEFSEKKIFATYEYLGRTVKEARVRYKEISKGGYKTVLLFCPKDTSIFDTKRVTSSMLIPTPTGVLDISASRKRTSFEQTFEVQLFKLDAVLTKVWSATIDIDCEPNKKSGSKKVGKKIIQRLRSNKYID